MIAEILGLITFLIENCTGVVLIESQQNDTLQSGDTETSQLVDQNPAYIETFTSFDLQDTIFEEYDPPKHLESDPQAWKQNLPSFKKSFWECLKTVLLIQLVAGALIGVAGIGLIIFEYITNYCYYEEWNKTPNNVKNLRVTGTCIVGFANQMFDFFFLWAVFPFSLINDLNLLAISIISALVNVIYKLFLRVFKCFTASWTVFPINAFFCLVIIINHYRVARHFYPRSFKNTMVLYFIITAQLFLGIPIAYFLAYRLFSFYAIQEQNMKIIIAAASPLLTALPKVVCRLGAQTLKGIINPGTAYVLVAFMYGLFAVVFRVLQAELTSLGLFIALGIAHAIIDLLERITITMRDHIWEYVYRLVRRQRSSQPKYRSPRSRRFIADMSIQIMMQESSALITALGFFSVYQSMYSEPKPFISYKTITNFFVRAVIGLSIDLFFSTFSLLIQTRVMNVAVNRVWKKKWRHHMMVNSLSFCISILFFGGYLITIVGDKYESSSYANRNKRNCTLPSFL